METAQKLLDAIKRLRGNIQRFEDEYAFHPALMADIFDADFGPPTELLVPESVAAIGLMLRDPEPWQAVERHLEVLTRLPLKPERPHGQIADVTLQAALSECRQYWRGQGLTWKSEMLDVATSQDDAVLLTGDCERFVSDALAAVGFDFTLEGLRRAWRRRAKSRKPASVS